jgi:hypothetical protein
METEMAIENSSSEAYASATGPKLPFLQQFGMAEVVCRESGKAPRRMGME